MSLTAATILAAQNPQFLPNFAGTAYWGLNFTCGNSNKRITFYTCDSVTVQNKRYWFVKFAGQSYPEDWFKGQICVVEWPLGEISTSMLQVRMPQATQRVFSWLLDWSDPMQSSKANHFRPELPFGNSASFKQLGWIVTGHFRFAVYWEVEGLKLRPLGHPRIQALLPNTCESSMIPFESLHQRRNLLSKYAVKVCLNAYCVWLPLHCLCAVESDNGANFPNSSW